MNSPTSDRAIKDILHRIQDKLGCTNYGMANMLGISLSTWNKAKGDSKRSIPKGFLSNLLEKTHQHHPHIHEECEALYRYLTIDEQNDLQVLDIKHREKQQHAINHIIEQPPGHILAFRGSFGMGKSTLITYAQVMLKPSKKKNPLVLAIPLHLGDATPVALQWLRACKQGQEVMVRSGRQGSTSDIDAEIENFLAPLRAESATPFPLWHHIFSLFASYWNYIVLLIDDMHCCTPAMISAIEQMMENPMVRCIFTYAAQPEHAFFEQWLQRQISRNRATIYELEPLPDDDAWHMYQGLAPAHLKKEQFISLCRGNPWFITEWARQNQQSQMPPRLSARAFAYIDCIYNGLSFLAQQIVTLVVHDTSLPQRELSYALSHWYGHAISPQQQAKALREACESGLIHAQGEDGCYQAGNDSIRFALQQRFHASRMLIHRELAEAFAQRADPRYATRIVHHFTEAQEIEHHLSYLLIAGQYAYQHQQWEEAITYLGKLVAYQDKHMMKEDAAQSRVLYVRALLAYGQITQAKAVLDYTCDVLPDAAQEIRIIRQEIVDLDGKKPSPLLYEWIPSHRTYRHEGYTALVQAMTAHRQAAYDKQEDRAKRALSIARKVGDARLQLRAEFQLGLALTYQGIFQQGIKVLARVADMAKRHNDLLTEFNARLMLSQGLLFSGQFGRHTICMQTITDLVKKLNQPAARFSAEFMEASHLHYTDPIDSGEKQERLLKAALEGAKEHKFDVLRLLIHSSLVRLYNRQSLSGQNRAGHIHFHLKEARTLDSTVDNAMAHWFYIHVSQLHYSSTTSGVNRVGAFDGLIDKSMRQQRSFWLPPLLSLQIEDKIHEKQMDDAKKIYEQYSEHKAIHESPDYEMNRLRLEILTYTQGEEPTQLLDLFHKKLDEEMRRYPSEDMPTCSLEYLSHSHETLIHFYTVLQKPDHAARVRDKWEGRFRYLPLALLPISHGR